MADDVANRTFATGDVSLEEEASESEDNNNSSDSPRPLSEEGTPATPGRTFFKVYRRSASVGEVFSSPSVSPASAQRQQLLRKHLLPDTRRGMSLAEFAVRREGKLLLAMVGLPARGKTYIAKSIKRHTDWFGMHTRIFNAGNYRRQVVGPQCPASFFDPSNEEGKQLRNTCAQLALHDALDSLADPTKDIFIAIFDATNTTKERRRWLKDEVAQHTAHIKLVFLETVLDDEARVWENVKEAKLKSPDYAGMDPEAAMKDFFQRIEQYKSVYEPCERVENTPFIRLTNAGEELLGFQAGGYMCGRVMQVMESMRLTLRPILLTRCGESEFEAQGRLGGDSRLTPVGQLYAERLTASIQKRREEGLNPVVWTSTRVRARQTVARLRDTGASFEVPILELAALDDIHPGAAEGMTMDEFRQKYPEVHRQRLRDKLHVRFPEGESYVDVFLRLEPLLLELVGEPQPVLIVAHLAVLRVLYGYLMGVNPVECPRLDIPMNCVLQLNPKGYGYEEWRHYPRL